MALSHFFHSISALQPAVTTPSLATTFARWSAAEANNGGLNGTGDWVSVDGSKTFLHNDIPFTFDATGLNGKPALAVSTNGSYYMNNVTLPNSSAATIVIMATPTYDVQVVYEYSENVNSIQNTFANYIESGNVEGYLDITGQKNLYSTPQAPLNAPMIIASRFYTNPRRATLKVNTVDAQDNYSNATTSTNDFGTQNLYLFSRANGQYFTKGQLAVYHLFHTAPSDTEWNQWIAYYKNLYQLP